MNMEESSEIKRKQNRLEKQVRKKEKTEITDQEKKRKHIGKVDKVNSDEAQVDAHGQDEGPPVKKPKRKLRKPTAEEDIIDGFAILAFKNYEELTRAIQLGENSDARICVQLLKRAEDGSVCKSVKDKKTPKAKNPPTPKIKSPKPRASPNKKKENSEKMANKLPGSEKKGRKSGSTGGTPKKVQRSNNGTSAPNEKIRNISDGCSDLFATPRKDSPPHLLDNLHSSHEHKCLDPQRSRINHHKDDHKDEKEVKSSSPPTEKVTPTPNNSPTSTAVTRTSTVTLECKPKAEDLDATLFKSLHTNEPLNLESSTERDINGHVGVTQYQSCENLGSPSQTQQKPPIQQTLFTPYATSAITRVSTPIGLGGSSVPEIPIQDQQSANHIGLQASSVNHNSYSIVPQTPLSDFTLSGSHIHRSSSASPLFDKTGTGTGCTAPTSSSGQRSSNTPTSKVETSRLISTKSTTAFGSIARLLDSPNTSSTNSSSPTTISASTTVTHSTNYNNSLNPLYHSQLTGSGREGPSSAPQSCSSRSLSPRSHSPPRERDSYSSNVSSLSRTSVTPVSGSSSTSQLPPNLSPLQSLSYSKAASWLSSVPGLSPVPRPTPPPPVLPPSSSGHLSNSGVSSLSGTTPSPLSVFPGLVSVPPPSHVIPPPAPNSTSAMFAPPILPLSSIMSSQSVPFGSSAESLFPGAAHSELVRRDLESRFLGSERITGGGGPAQFLTRPGELHPHHHQLLSHLSGVNVLSPHNTPGTNPALFTPPMFKDLKLDSPFYRNLGISYPGFNGILPPPPNLTTPFTPPSQLPSFTPKKSGRWNAMHVRIAWEIYQHQQKNGSDNKNSPNNSNVPGTNSLPAKSSASTPTTSQPPTDMLRPPNHLFSGLNRSPDAGPPHFASPLLSPHQQRGPFDPTHPLFLHSVPHLGPSLARYPGFGNLGPSFGGLSGLGSSLLGRDLASLASLGPSQEQWQRMHRAQFPSGVGGWQIPRPERDVKTPTESRRHKEEKRHELDRHSDAKSSRGDISPFRDRSPVRPSRTPLENGDTDSRSSRSSDSHSVHTSSKSRFKEEPNGDREKVTTPHHATERDKGNQLSVVNDVKALNYITGTHPSRLFHAASPLGPMTTGWDSFPGLNSAGPRMSSAESFRLSLIQLNEREKEYRLQSSLQRPPQYPPNGPFMSGLTQLPLQPQLPAGGSSSSGSNNSSNNSSTKSSPLGVPIPSTQISHHHLSLHHSSSHNGSNSPNSRTEERGKEAR